jgi:putative peptide zinc metalloprotease protein
MTTVTATPESTTTETETWPQLLAGTELIGQAAGSGLREAPYLVRRCDGQVVQLSPILYELVGLMEGRDPEAIADAAAEDLDLRVTPDQITQIAETKLAPLGLVRYQDGSTAPLQRRNALLLLRYRVGIVPTRAVHVIGGLLAPLFWAPLVLLAIVALMGADVWMFSSSGVISGVRTVIQTPDLMLATFGVTILSLAFHECGHAAACRYGGASPGRIGVGIYLVWPVFYTDVTDSYRLSRAGRLRTDLGGVYFNGLISLAAVGGFLLSGYRPLLLVAAGQQALMIEQFVPWMRLDGYHVISDLIGVSDLFARIRPVISSMLPGREPSRRVTELKPWARRVVTVWVMMSVTALLGMLAYAGAFAPRIIPRPGSH